MLPAAEELHERVVRVLNVVQQLSHLLLPELVARAHVVESLDPAPDANLACKLSGKLGNFVEADDEIREARGDLVLSCHVELQGVHRADVVVDTLRGIDGRGRVTRAVHAVLDGGREAHLEAVPG